MDIKIPTSSITMDVHPKSRVQLSIHPSTTRNLIQFVQTPLIIDQEDLGQQDRQVGLYGHLN
jgi:hypothetical protein